MCGESWIFWGAIIANLFSFGLQCLAKREWQQLTRQYQRYVELLEQRVEQLEDE